jgi:hypothetical protein
MSTTLGSSTFGQVTGATVLCQNKNEVDVI